LLERNHHHQSTTVCHLRFAYEGRTALEDYILPADICNKEHPSASLVDVLTAAKLI